MGCSACAYLHATYRPLETTDTRRAFHRGEKETIWGELTVPSQIRVHALGQYMQAADPATFRQVTKN